MRRTLKRNLPSRRPQRSAGFSLIELLISMAITVVTLVGVLTLFNSGSRIANVQTNVSDMQQSLRFAQHDLVQTARMAGRGGMPARDGAHALPAGLAVEVLNNAGTNAYISPGDASTPEVLDGTDVLTLRGAFTAPIYRVSDGAVTLNLPSDGTLTVSNKAAQWEIPQDLEPLKDAVTNGINEALLVVTKQSQYAVVELNPGSSDITSDPNNIILAFDITTGVRSTEYNMLSPNGTFPGSIDDDPTEGDSIAFVAVLEEYRYYIRELIGDSPDTGQDELLPRLSRARVFPGSDDVYAGDPTNWSVDVAENVFDLQVALGVDSAPIDGAVVEDPNNAAADEWLFNDAGDDATLASWNSGQLFYLRLTTLARSDRRDTGSYEADPLTIIEDHNYATSFLNDQTELKFHRRQLQTVVDIRNL